MARLNKKQARKRYWLNAILLILPVWYIYKAFNPTFPDSLPVIDVGSYSLSAMPYNEDAPYQHDGIYVKDFLVLFQKGDVDNIRQAFVNIGKNPIAIADAEGHELGILHGSKYGKEVHALAQAALSADDKVWITLQTWDGEVYQGAWPLPAFMVSESS